MKGKYEANKVAEYIIRYCDMINISINNLSLQNILYLSQVQYYRQTQEWLIKADFEAWRFGAVIPEVYYKYCIYGACKLPCPKDADPLPTFVCDIINPVIEKCAGMEMWDFADMVQRKGGAWDTVIQNRGIRGLIHSYLIVEDACGKSTKKDLMPK